MDLNHRPHAYQACALNQLSYRPVRAYIHLRVDLSKLNKVSTMCRFPFLNILRKEVIQPQVLLRLPCYDFTPIICPTLDG